MYAFANPGSYVDPTGNGNDTAHYYDALLIGQLVGLNESQSFAFALGAQIGDEFTQFDAVHNSAGYVAIKGFVQSSNQSKAVESIVNSSLQSKITNNCGAHALCGTKPSFLRNAATNFILNDAQNFLEVGTADHSFTDSFFHIAKGELSDPENQKLLKPIIGHFWEKTNTDKAFRYHESKRVEAFEARAWLLYDFSVKQGTQKISKKQFKDDLNKAVTALGRQHDNLLRNNQKWGYADGGVYTLFTDYDDISDEEEFDMVRDMLSGKGLSKIPRTENHSPARNVNGLLNDFSKEQLIGIALEISKNIDRSQIDNISKSELVKYVNGKLFLSQAKSRDAIYAGVMREKAKAEVVQESEDKPGVKELSK
jgi:hypothetical protein